MDGPGRFLIRLFLWVPGAYLLLIALSAYSTPGYVAAAIGLIVSSIVFEGLLLLPRLRPKRKPTTVGRALRHAWAATVLGCGLIGLSIALPDPTETLQWMGFVVYLGLGVPALAWAMIAGLALLCVLMVERALGRRTRRLGRWSATGVFAAVSVAGMAALVQLMFPIVWTQPLLVMVVVIPVGTGAVSLVRRWPNRSEGRDTKVSDPSSPQPLSTILSEA